MTLGEEIRSLGYRIHAIAVEHVGVGLDHQVAAAVSLKIKNCARKTKNSLKSV